MKFEMKELPFDYDALEPFLSARTVDLHYNKHHAGYLEKLDKALDGKEREQSLEEIVVNSCGTTFNLAAQVWNHDFYWQSLSAAPTKPSDPDLLQRMDTAFGGLEGFEARFAEAAVAEFGSGWVWLLQDPDTLDLSITSTTDAVNPLKFGKKPLLTLDVWEHAYYLDYQNRRADYIAEFLRARVNWPFVEYNFERAAKLAVG